MSQTEPCRKVDRVLVDSSGGGYGSPIERDPGLVLEDVLEGWETVERARDIYGVVFTDAGEAGFAVDGPATETRRRALLEALQGEVST